MSLTGLNMTPTVRMLISTGNVDTEISTQGSKSLCTRGAHASPQLLAR